MTIPTDCYLLAWHVVGHCTWKALLSLLGRAFRLRGKIPNVHLRVTLSKKGTKKEQLLAVRGMHKQVLAAGMKRAPLEGEHTRLDGRMYFDVIGPDKASVEKIVAGAGATVDEVPQVLDVSECLNCGNVAEQEATVCPNCAFRDVSPCPQCNQEIPRKSYVTVAGDLHQCPNCKTFVRLVFNDPLWHEDGTYNQPVVRVLLAGK